MSRIVKKGEQYRHWKPTGNTYEVFDVAEPIFNMPSDSNVLHRMTAVYTEDNNPQVLVYVTDKGVYSEWEQTLVLYQVAVLNPESPLAKDGGKGQYTLWARPYEMFTEDVDYKDGTWGPRFRKVEK